MYKIYMDGTKKNKSSALIGSAGWLAHFGLSAKFLERSSTCKVLEACHLGYLSQIILSGFTFFGETQPTAKPVVKRDKRTTTTPAASAAGTRR